MKKYNYLKEAREQREMEFKTCNIPKNKKGEFIKDPFTASNESFKQRMKRYRINWD